MPEDMPDKMPEGMSDRMPEDLPVTKCINVMVGITRSKVILQEANLHAVFSETGLSPDSMDVRRGHSSAENSEEWSTKQMTWLLEVFKLGIRKKPLISILK